MNTDAYILLITHQFNSNFSFRIVSDAVRRRKLRQLRKATASKLSH